MSNISSIRPIIDSHVHIRHVDQRAGMERIRAALGIERMNIVCIYSREVINHNPSGFAAKVEYPGNFYVFGGLDHSAYWSDGKIETPSLVEQVDRLLAIGCDGIKMLENKPTHRRMVDLPIDGPYFAEYFEHVEALGVPIVWHVNDPEEFWFPELTPGWAKSRGWGYDQTWIPKEQLYSEVGNVLERHPDLNIVFAHFYFLSADLPRASRLLDQYPNVKLDVCPGIEMFYNMSRNPDAAREFFLKYQDRLILGTDICSDHTDDEARKRLGVITRWLSTSDEFRVPEGADFVLGPPEDGIMRGIALPTDVLSRIYRTNFEGLVGPPNLMDRELAFEESMRIAREASILNDVPIESTQAYTAAQALNKD